MYSHLYIGWLYSWRSNHQCDTTVIFQNTEKMSTLGYKRIWALMSQVCMSSLHRNHIAYKLMGGWALPVTFTASLFLILWLPPILYFLATVSACNIKTPLKKHQKRWFNANIKKKLSQAPTPLPYAQSTRGCWLLDSPAPFWQLAPWHGGYLWCRAILSTSLAHVLSLMNTLQLSIVFLLKLILIELTLLLVILKMWCDIF